MVVGGKTRRALSECGLLAMLSLGAIFSLLVPSWPRPNSAITKTSQPSAKEGKCPMLVPGGQDDLLVMELQAQPVQRPEPSKEEEQEKARKEELERARTMMRDAEQHFRQM